jgi:hypothetical protein
MRILTAAIVNIATQDNATFQDAFQFGVPGDTTWGFGGVSFEMSIKASRDDTSPLITFTSGAGQIVVDDIVNRVLHFNVPDTTIQASLPVATYVYDFIMIDGSTPPVRTPLMQGQLGINRGVTET